MDIRVYVEMCKKETTLKKNLTAQWCLQDWKTHTPISKVALELYIANGFRQCDAGISLDIWINGKCSRAQK